jgi:putative hydrolase of the HAD superfamily
MQNYGVDDYFDGVFLSQELHVEKPDDRIFQIVIKETGIDPNESLFVDDLEKNCQAAERNGFHTFQNKSFDDWLEILSREHLWPSDKSITFVLA